MTTNKGTSNDKPQGVEFVIAGLAGIGTALITNPADVLKTRLQLQGELSRPGSYRKLYRNTFHAAYHIAKSEGILALQSGIAPVLGLQIIINTVRLGSYNFAKSHGFTLNDKGETDVLRTAALAGVAGSVAIVIGSPLYLTKVQLQAHSALNVGRNMSSLKILKNLWQENGFKSLYRDWNANIPRLFIGSAVQLTTYGILTDRLKNIDILSGRPMIVTFAASVVSGTTMIALTHPLDVMATRLYNQGIRQNGTLYSGMLDAILKIIRVEGFYGLYKGFFPNWLRIAPYIVSVQILYEKISLVHENFEQYTR